MFKFHIMIRNIVIVIILMFLTGCGAYHYVASPAFVPLNEKKGELKVNISPVGVQAGYPFSDHLSVFATYFDRFPDDFYWKEFDLEHVGDDCYTDDACELNMGLSYYNSYLKVRYEILAGGGPGYIKYESPKDLEVFPDEFKMHANRVNFFIQPTVGYGIKDIFYFGAFCRLNAYRYYNIQTYVAINSISNDYLEPNDLLLFADRKTMNLFLIEPGLMVRIGYKFVHFQTMISFTNNMSNYDLIVRYDNLYFFSIFLNFNLFEKNE